MADESDIVMPICKSMSKKIVGNTHQADYGCNQCVAMAYTGIAMSWMSNTSAANWDITHLDHILQIGHINYLRIVKSIKSAQECPMLTIDIVQEILIKVNSETDIVIPSLKFSSNTDNPITILKSIEKQVPETAHKKLILTINMYQSIENLLNDRSVMGLIIIYKHYAFSVIKSLNGIYFFDSHSNYNVYTNAWGAMLLQVANSIDIVRVLLLKLGMPETGVDVTGIMYEYKLSKSRPLAIKDKINDYTLIVDPSCNYDILDVLLQYMYNSPSLRTTITKNIRQYIPENAMWKPFETQEEFGGSISSENDAEETNQMETNLNDKENINISGKRKKKYKEKQSIKKEQPKKTKESYIQLTYNSEKELNEFVQQIQNKFYPLELRKISENERKKKKKK